MTLAVSSSAAVTAVAVIPLAAIHCGGNVRQELGDIESLADSIRQHGVLTAVLVERRGDGGFELVAGFRRVAAAEVAGLAAISAVVRDPVAGVQRVSHQLAETDDRCALSQLDVAGAMQQMLDLGASADEVATRFATSTDTIERWRAVLALPPALLALVRDGTIEAGDLADRGELGEDEESRARSLPRSAQGRHCAGRSAGCASSVLWPPPSRRCRRSWRRRDVPSWPHRGTTR